MRQIICNNNNNNKNNELLYMLVEDIRDTVSNITDEEFSWLLEVVWCEQ